MSLDRQLLDILRHATPVFWGAVSRRTLVHAAWQLSLGYAVTRGIAWWLPAASRPADWVGPLDLATGILLLAGGGLLAVSDALQAVLVEGPLLRRLGTLVLAKADHPSFPLPTQELAGFASPERLAGLVRVRDLPLLLVVVRLVLMVDAKGLLQQAARGLDRAELLAALEAQARRRARVLVCRLRLAGGVGLLALLAAWSLLSLLLP